MKKLYQPLNIKRFSTLLLSWDTYYVRSGTATPLHRDAKSLIRIYLESQNAANNTSYIRIQHNVVFNRGVNYDVTYLNTTSKFRANQGGYGGTYQTKSLGRYEMDSWDAANRTVDLGSTYHTVTHNADGTGTLYVNGTFTTTIGVAGATSGTTYSRNSAPAGIALPTIPRATSITGMTTSNITLNSVQVNWSTAHNVSQVWGSVGSGWVSKWTGSAKSGSFSMTGLNPNTTYSLGLKVKRADSGIETEKWISFKTLDKAKISSSPNNIDVEQPFTVNINRNGATTAELAIYNTSGGLPFASYRSVSGSSYTFNLTNAEKNAILNDMQNANSKTYRIYLRTNSSGGYLDYVDRTFKVTNANPVFSDFAYENIDKKLPSGINERVLTGSATKFIKGYSDLKVNISGENLATAQKGALMKEYKLEVQGMSAETATASSDVEILKSNITNESVTVRAVDTRENPTAVQKTVDLINYNPITIGGVVVERQDGGAGETTKLNISGTYCDCDFGAVNNDLEIDYYYRNPGETNWGYPPGWAAYTEASFGDNGYWGYAFVGPLGLLEIGEPVKFNLEHYLTHEVIEVTRPVDKIIPSTSRPGEYAFWVNLDGLPSRLDEYNLESGSFEVNVAWVKGTTPITVVKSGNNFSVSDLTINGDITDGFTLGQSFDIRVVIKDKVMIHEELLILGSGTPNIALHKDGTAIGGMYDDTLDKGIQLYGDNIYLNGIPLIEWEEI